MKCIIIEDEKPAARRLTRMVTDLQVTVDAVLHSVQEAIEYLSNQTAPDMIFLDIQLSDGLSFEIFDHVTITSAIIFTTAYDEYALQAFKHNSVDYLLKPIDEEDLKRAVTKYQSYYQKPIEQQIPTIDYNAIAKLLSNPVQNNYKHRFMARVGEHLKLFTSSDIQLFYSENKGLYIHLNNGRNYLLDGNLESIEKELDPNLFYRISRQAIINRDAVKEMVSYTNSRLKLVIPTFQEYDLIVSREKVKDFKEWSIR